MYFRFDLEKTIQATAELIRHEPGRQMSRLRLLKLLYIADREAIAEYGRPIVWDSFVAMKHGPVLGKLYQIIKGEDVGSARFDEYFRQDGHTLLLEKDPGNSRLNRYEVRKLRELSERYRNADEWEIAEETHGFEEWIKNNPGESSKPIRLLDILTALGFPPARKEAVLRDAKNVKRLAAALERACHE